MPAALLPWLAWAVSVDYWDSSWTEQQKRNVVAASIEVHQHKGTVSAMRRVVEALGFDFSIVEWWETTPAGTPCTADVYISSLTGQTVTSDDLALMRILLEDAKRATLEITVTQAEQLMDTLHAYARFDTFETAHI